MNATIEAGLPGTGPPPVHLHAGKPTPWSEGCVVRFTSRSGVGWVGNIQRGFGYATKLIEWLDAKAFIVIAKGAVYFVRPDDPNHWVCLDLLGIDCRVAPQHDVALVSTYTDVFAISKSGIELWRRTVAIDGVEITEIGNALVRGEAGIDPPDEWQPFVLDIATGNDAERLI
ncbi:hypothetical protein LOC67_17065 [Stieleria sp. JC731]|uniref:hypothetical protein n=1 Tax=Pirellulaceae TaxID=2691357 RepID=UPI001E5B9DA3|nr:hypothetical protein [Stieleria sp. JC731]MCC9602267.1 hypothetical protein [Stieleria sp. JC731]